MTRSGRMTNHVGMTPKTGLLPAFPRSRHNPNSGHRGVFHLESGAKRLMLDSAA
jgi:hypothetical protein